MCIRDRYWYATNYSFEYLPLMVSEKAWKKLSPEDQKIFREAAKNFTLKSISTAESEDTKYMKLMEKKGIKVHKYSAKELKPIKDACVGIWDELGKRGLTPEPVSYTHLYKSVKKPVKTVGDYTCIVVRNDIPDSLAYDLCKSLWENKANLAKAVKDIDELTPQIAVPNGVPTQAGALKFWKEQQAKTKK